MGGKPVLSPPRTPHGAMIHQDMDVVLKSVSNSISLSEKSPKNVSNSMEKEQELIYWVKETIFLQRNILYICQNINGPCPLLAICNVLLLRGHLNIDQYIQTQGNQLFIYARDVTCVVEERLRTTNQHFNEMERATLDEVITLLHTLQVGLDVNVQFHDVGAFEYTSACAIFDLLDMRLLHGWVVDPQDVVTHSILGNKSYNHIIERLIDYHGVLETKEQSVPTLMKERSLSAEEAHLKFNEISNEGPIIDRFLNESASQLTYCGLVSLHEQLKERELAVFFRNNHFATIFKWQGSLYLLVTDAGYYEEPNVIWEKLDEIDGDSEYYTMHFKPLVAQDTKQQTLLQQQPIVPLPPQIPPVEDTSDDFALALKLQQEEEAAIAEDAKTAEFAAKGVRPAPNERRDVSPTSAADIDLLQLSEEEIKLQREAEEYYKQQKLRKAEGSYVARRTSPVYSNTSSEGSDSNCLVM